MARTPGVAPDVRPGPVAPAAALTPHVRLRSGHAADPGGQHRRRGHRRAGSPRGPRRPRGPGRAAPGRVAAALGPAGRPGRRGGPGGRVPAGRILAAGGGRAGLAGDRALPPGAAGLLRHRTGLRARLLRAPAVLAGQRGLVRVGRAGHRRGGDLRAAGGGPAAPARAARLAAGGGRLVGGGRGDAVPLALCLPVGPPGDEPGGRAHRGLGRDRRTPAAVVPGRADRGDAGVAGAQHGPQHGLRHGPRPAPHGPRDGGHGGHRRAGPGRHPAPGGQGRGGAAQRDGGRGAGRCPARPVPAGPAPRVHGDRESRRRHPRPWPRRSPRAPGPPRTW